MELISIAHARKLALSAAVPTGRETVAAAEAHGRYLARELVAATDVPPFSASAMDGYAVAPGPAGRRLELIGESRAGAPSERELPAGAAIRISTGAEVPPGAGAVIRQEDVATDGSAITLRAEVGPGENIRAAGEVFGSGQPVLPRGIRLGPAEIAAAISAGAGELEVSRRPKVAVLSTGDELRDPGARLAPGQIHDSNRPMLIALSARAGALPAAGGRLPDERERTEAGLRDALATADVVIVAGGVSVGPHDHVKPALATLGVRELAWGIALAPGKPTWIGAREDKLVFGLPGNPVSAAVTFALFVAPALAALQGAAEPLPRRRQVPLTVDVKRNAVREQALRVRLEYEGEHVRATPTGAQASHYITSLLGAEALALIPPGEGVVSAGTPVALELLPR